MRVSFGMVFTMSMAICLAACQAPASYRQANTPAPGQTVQAGKAIVILAVDFREQTSLRNVDHTGRIFFRKWDAAYPTRKANDYDFGIEYSFSTGLEGVFGKPDANRAPHIFELEPGNYVVERIIVAGNASTFVQGVEPSLGRPSFGAFSVAAGEVLNLGTLTVEMHWYQGYFLTRSQEGEDAARNALATTHPELAEKMQTRVLSVSRRISFKT